MARHSRASPRQCYRRKDTRLLFSVRKKRMVANVQGTLDFIVPVARPPINPSDESRNRAGSVTKV